MGAGQSWGSWPVLLVLLVAVLVPTACVLWFMNAAMSNERLAIQQKLKDVYRKQLLAISATVDKQWREKLDALETLSGLHPAEAFSQLVRAGVADSALIFDDAGNVSYPLSQQQTELNLQQRSPQWLEADKLEYQLRQPQRAADAYAKIANQFSDTTIQAQALQAQARCLIKARQKQKALDIIIGPLAKNKYQNTTDARGRLIVPNSQLLALQLTKDSNPEEFLRLATALTRRLNDYDDLAMPWAQRRFLMQSLRQILPEPPQFPTLNAEALAAQYLESQKPPPLPNLLTRLGQTDLWHIASQDKRVVMLFQTPHIDLGKSHSDDDRLVRAIGICPVDDSTAFITVPVSKYIPGIQLGVYLVEDPFAEAASRQNAAYLWTGCLGILAIAILALIVAIYVRRQMKLTRLRNDLIATVSHELKTPLASMRVLVDTLLEGRYKDQQQARDYFALIAKENERLSRLIDNFLTFSRMERNKKAFEFAELDLAEIVTAAVDSVADRFCKAGCQLEIEIAPNLPTISADQDALVTVLLNLLDNAYKYSRDEKRITLRAYAADDCLCLAVTDNGIGLSRRAIRKIFNRFYQVDQSLARKAGGCGLGLSIVKFIVEAHGGTIEVTSQLGQGSTFTVRLPAQEGMDST